MKKSERIAALARQVAELNRQLADAERRLAKLQWELDQARKRVVLPQQPTWIPTPWPGGPDWWTPVVTCGSGAAQRGVMVAQN